nr:hypothetical protein BaRGS_004350 [Batillaria attramentaria]
MPRVQETDVRDDRAMQQVLQSIRQLAERRQEVMMVLSQLEFRKYLDNQVDPITAAATRLLPRPATLGNPDGDFDILLVSRQYGLVVGEVKSVGHKPKYTTDQAIVKTVQKAVKQLKKADVTLRQLVSDLAPVNVTRILMLPNITSQQLMTALSTDPQTEQFIVDAMWRCGAESRTWRHNTSTRRRQRHPGKVLDILCEAMPDKEWKPEDIIRAHRIGDKASGTENSKPRPLIAKFARWAEKMNLLTKGREALRRKGIAVSADLTTSQSQTLRKYRNDGINAYYKGDKLVVGGPWRGRGRHADQDSGDNIGDGAGNNTTATATHVNNDNTPTVDCGNQSVSSDAHANREDTPRVGQEVYNMTIRSLKVVGQEVYNITIRSLKVFGQEVYNMTIRSLKVVGQEVYNISIRSLKVFGQEVYNITIGSLKVVGQEVYNITIRSLKDLCQCVGATDTAAAVARCLCADSSEWWERSVTDHGQDTNMTNDIYERLVARFCGPATSIEVPTVTTPRRCMELRTETEAIAHTGLRMAVLTLFPDQVALVNKPEPQPPQQDLVILWGPPEGWPEDCEGCADNIVNLLVKLRVGQSGHDLQYRDTVILCRAPRDDLPMVRRLRARGLPVQVVTSGDDEAAIRDVAVTMKDTIVVTDRMSVTASIILIFTIVINSSFIVINN